MQFHEFITRVQEQSGLKTDEEAIQITRAVLETLGERLDRKVRNGLAAQLSKELKEFLLARTEHSEQYDVQEFYRRVGARADLTYEDARKRTQQVISVLREAVPEGEINDILEDLTPAYRTLFA